MNRDQPAVEKPALVELVDFARSVGAPRSVAVHDGMLSDNGLTLVGGLISGMLEPRGLSYERVSPREEVTLR